MTRRGRLTRIERLPAGLAPAVARVFDALSTRQGGQDQLLSDLNEALAAAGIAAISRSGFNRYSARVDAGIARRPIAAAANAETLTAALTALTANAPAETALAALAATIAAVTSRPQERTRP